MADIKVEKKGSANWLWILLAIAAVALLAWLLFGGNDDVETAEVVETDAEYAVVDEKPVPGVVDRDREPLVVEDDPADLTTTAENIAEDELAPEGYEEIEAEVVTTELDADATAETDGMTTGMAAQDDQAPTRIASLKQNPAANEGIVTLERVRVTDVVGDRTFMVSDDSNEEMLVVLDEVGTPNDPTEGRYDVTEGQMIDVTGTVREVQDGMIDGQRIEDMPAGTNVYLWADKADIEERP
jgi:hypothetical protein